MMGPDVHPSMRSVLLTPHDFNLMLFAIGVASGVASREDDERLLDDFLKLVRTVLDSFEEERSHGPRQ